MKRLPSLAIFPLLALSVALAGCDPGTSSPAGGGGGGGGGGPGTATSLTGSVVKGVTANAVITVYAPGTDGAFTLIDSTTSNDQGAYALTLPVGFAGAIKIVATASHPPAAPTLMRCDAAPATGCGTFPDTTNVNDLDHDGLIDFGEWSQVADDFELRAVAAVDGNGVRLINLTPLSTVAADWAQEFPQGLDATSATLANTQAAVTFGFETADLDLPLSDMANPDPVWRNLASPEQIRLQLLMATFQELAQHVGFDPQNVIEAVSQEFSGNHGRLLEVASADSSLPTVFNILSTTATLAGVLDVPDIHRDEIRNSMRTALDGLRDGVYSIPIETTAMQFVDRLGPLGVDLRELMDVTGLDEPLVFSEQQIPYFNWLLARDNLNIVPLAIDTALYAVIGSGMIEHPAISGLAELPLMNTPEFKVTLKPSIRKLTLVGVRYGQDVNLTISLTGLQSGIRAKRFDFGIVGTLDNGTAHGEIDGTMSIDTGTTDLGALAAAVSGVSVDTTVPGSDQLKAFLLTLVQSANGTLTLEGTARLVRNSDPEQVLSIAGALNASVDMAAAPGTTIATLNVTRGELLLPNGSTLYGVEGKNILTVVVGDDATVVLDGDGQVLNLPVATAHAQGTLVNARALFVHVQNVLAEAIQAPTLDLGAAITALFDFDFSQMAIRGTGVIDIPGMPSGRAHQYRAALDNTTLTIFQPHSTDVAMSINLDVEHQVAHMLIGHEPWDMRVMMTPTPRLMMLGPQGQFAEVSQEDIFSFLGSLNLFPAVPAT